MSREQYSSEMISNALHPFARNDMLLSVILQKLRLIDFNLLQYCAIDDIPSSVNKLHPFKLMDNSLRQSRVKTSNPTSVILQKFKDIDSKFLHPSASAARLIPVTSHPSRSMKSKPGHRSDKADILASVIFQKLRRINSNSELSCAIADTPSSDMLQPLRSTLTSVEHLNKSISTHLFVILRQPLRSSVFIDRVLIPLSVVSFICNLFLLSI